MSQVEAREQVFATLQARDQKASTICVGGAAIAVHMAEAGVSLEPQADVDVLCSQEYFTALSIGAVALTDASKFQIRWPFGAEDVRALSPIIDIYPDENHPNLLPFSACEALGGTWFPISYGDCIEESLFVEFGGYKFLRLEKLLVWTAYSGPGKDIAKLDTLLPIVQAMRLVGESDFIHIMLELEETKRLRMQYPERFHARIRNGDPIGSTSQ